MSLRPLALLVALLLLATPAIAADIAFTVTMSEPVIVTGQPQIAVDVGGAAKQATYRSGSGTSALTFAYTVQQGDFDADGITLSPSISLPTGSSITDLAGNPLSNTSFTAPSTSGLKVETYTAAFTSTSNPAAISFTISKAPGSGSFSYAITSGGGPGEVSGSGSLTGSTQAVSGVDVSALAAGTLTLSVTVSNASGTGAPRTDTLTPGFTGALDGLPAAAAAFSVRRLRGAYTGPLLRVQRASDNLEQNIGATVGGNLDTSALSSFCSSTSCFVSTWFDQSGNGQDATALAPSLQPRLVNSGAIETEGSRPALRYLGGGEVLALPMQADRTAAYSLNAVARCADTSVNRHVLGDRGMFAPGSGRLVRAVAGGGSYGAGNLSGGGVTLTGSTAQQRVITVLSSLASMSGALDGAFAAGSTNSAYLASSTSPLWVGGGGNGQSGSGDWLGTISEVTVYTITMDTTTRQTLERSQGSYFGLSVQ